MEFMLNYFLTFALLNHWQPMKSYIKALLVVMASIHFIISSHPNAHVLRLVLNHSKINPSNKIMDFCSACCVGKSHRLPSSMSETVYSTPLELIFSDLWRPSHIPSTNGYLDYVSFVDAFSRFTWIYPLKLKSETFTVFQNFKFLVELQFNTKIKSIQTDLVTHYNIWSSNLSIGFSM